ncbi:hypothetical protein HZC34_01310 [Candidatus Saganbacteria bacterium]|nr:hypothetical protein [Candidatus Saganbacteria bacterium]
MNNKKCLLAIVLLLLGACLSFASVPAKMSYEGRLTDSSGTAVTTSKTIDIRIYDASTAGNVVWGPESFTITPDSQGVFSLVLGSTSPISPEVFSNSSRYLDLTVAGENMSPRTQIVSAGYSNMSAVAQSVEDGSISNAKIANSTITNTKVTANQFVKNIVAGSGVSVSGDEGSGTGQVTLTVTSVSTSGGTVTQVNSGAGLTGGSITVSGTISLEVPVSAINGGTGQSTYATGDILYASGANTLSKLPAGSNGKVLKLTAGIPSWESAEGTGTVTQVDTGNGLSGGTGWKRDRYVGPSRDRSFCNAKSDHFNRNSFNRFDCSCYFIRYSDFDE